MMNKLIKLNIYIIFSCSILIISTSCGHRHSGEEKTTLLSNILNITDNEDKGVKAIINQYGGYCEYSLGYTLSASSGKKKYFELKLSRSAEIEKYTNVLRMPGSNIAYLFYHSLKDERNNYDEIHTILLLNDGTTKTFIYPKDTLDLVDNKMGIVNKMVNLLESRNFEEVTQIFKPDTTLISHYDKKVFISNLSKCDSAFGTIQEFIPYGFLFYSANNGHRILHIAGLLSREKQSTNFSVDIDTYGNNDNIVMMNYQL